MNRKQLTLLLVALFVLGGAGLLLTRKEADAWKAGNASLGRKLLGDLPVNDVTRIDIRQGTNALGLVKKGDDWHVTERADYPANFSEISDFLLKVRDVKIVQSEPIGASQLARLELTEPGKGTNSGTVVEFKGKDGKSLGALLLGKKHMKKPAQPSGMGMGDEGWPDGRYVQLRSKADEVILISDALANIEPKPESWLNKDFFKIDKIRSLALLSPTNAAGAWKLSRDTESASDWKLADLMPGETVDSSKTSSLNYALSSPSFNDVVLPGAKPEDLGLDKPTVLTVETFDDFTYTLRVGGKAGEDAYHLALQIAANLPKERTAGKDEKAEDKDRLDKEFKDKVKKLEEKLAQEKACEKWTYVVSKWTFDSLLKERKDFLAEKKAEEKKDDAPPDAPPAPAIEIK